MNATDKQELLSKNEKLINMVIERAKRDYPEEIAIIGLTGSFRTGDFHDKSDLDLIIINNNNQGWGISSCFILGDVGYDIYCTPWETRIEEQAALEHPMIASLVDLQVLYCAKPEYLEKLSAYQQRALEALDKPIGSECLGRAKKWIDLAKQEYANTLLAEDLGAVRLASAEVVYNLVNALSHMNNTYFKRGLKRYLEDSAAYRYIPENYEAIYMNVIRAKSVDEIRSTSQLLLKSILDLYHTMVQEYANQPVPTYDNLAGSYEELWCNYRNKVIASTEAKDASYAFYAAMGAQEFLDDMTDSLGTRKFDIMPYFDADRLDLFKEQFLKAMDEYLEEYHRAGRKVARYDTFEELYSQYMKL
ncbi:nucleotidyltransferase domain-containing protein [Paenibacillus tritici]|uniref:nucleotidyltransferase domain-containing protein n=1 Tax=Paenibacillus tritici TaxID=1873425 RepID=UPI001BAAF643|nr:nucleotidyltransferase domain-containing protein [Paenibacillus tritici]QUL57297.1 nucleotidyltransferase domain-containing protein [Paenibacillus tritici]